MTPRLRIENLSKAFPGVQALSGVSLEVAPGEIHAICGENGAGKSTLVKIVSGVYAPDSGSVELDGQSIVGIDEARAGRLGIGIVHQEGSLVGTLSIAENVFAGRQPTTFLGQVDRKKMNALTLELLEPLGVKLDPKALIQDISHAEAQAVEIAKALSLELKLLILDEPTAALTIAEAERLFSVARKLAAQGISILYISHRLAEIFSLCDRVTVLKDGRLSGTRKVKETHRDELIQMMVGREVKLERSSSRRSGQTPILQVETLAALGVKKASLSVYPGQIVCLAGLIGAGRSELCEALFGVRPYHKGWVKLDEKVVRFKHPAEAMRAGLGMVPEDRKQSGLFLEMSLKDNISASNLAAISPGGIVSEARNRALARQFVERLRIATPSINQRVGNLSGGNQQKVLLAKWLARGPKLLIVDEPTRGVDVGARAEIYRILRELAAQGVGLLVVSSDLPEVLTLADQVVVMAEGETVGEIPGEEADDVGILRLASAYTHVRQAPGGHA